MKIKLKILGLPYDSGGIIRPVDSTKVVGGYGASTVVDEIYFRTKTGGMFDESGRLLSQVNVLIPHRVAGVGITRQDKIVFDSVVYGK